jgi:hypothetical protein
MDDWFTTLERASSHLERRTTSRRIKMPGTSPSPVRRAFLGTSAVGAVKGAPYGMCTTLKNEDNDDLIKA